jgi:diacylglycerol kinase (ATP)
VRLTLIHNPGAGGEGHAPDDLVVAIERAGHHVRHFFADDEDWKKTLEDTDVCVAAGGDGTVHDVFRHLAGTGVPAAVLPLGSANNVARSIGMPLDGEVTALAHGWSHAPRRRFDIPTIRSDDADDRFVEAAGGGLFAEAIARASNSQHDRGGGDKLRKGLQALMQVTSDYTAREWTIHADEADLSGDLIGVEIMNVSTTGPSVQLAPGAKPGDGFLEVVTIRPSDSASLTRYLRARLADSVAAAPTYRSYRAKRITLIPPPGAAIRRDDELCRHRGQITATTDERWLPVLMPC